MSSRILRDDPTPSLPPLCPPIIEEDVLISSLDTVLLLKKEFLDPLNEVLDPRALMDAREPWIEFRDPWVEDFSACLFSCCPSGVGRWREGELPGNLRMPVEGDPLKVMRP